MIEKICIEDINEIWILLNCANYSSLTHYSQEDIQLFKKANTKKLIKKYILENSYLSFSYSENNKILWYIVYNTIESKLYRLYVLPTDQWKSIGTKLLRYIITLAYQHKNNKIIVPARENAIWFYEKQWFIQTGGFQDWQIGNKIFKQNLLVLDLEAVK